jgi:hypothetical protein
MYAAIMQFVAIIYGISAFGMITYFNWLYAVQNGFWKWLLFGEIVATFQGLLWPFFINW